MNSSTDTSLSTLKRGSTRETVRLLPRVGIMVPFAIMLAIILSLSFMGLLGAELMPDSYTRKILYAVLGIVAIGLTALILSRLHSEFLSPLVTLREWSQRIRAGDLNTHIPLPKRGEFSGLIRDINSLTDEMNVLTGDMDAKVKGQTEHIASKTRSLELLYDIASDLSTTRNLDELLEQFLDTLMVLVDAQAATVRMLSDDGNTYLVAGRGLTPSITEQEKCVPVNRCLCGKIAQNGGFGIQQGVAECNVHLSEPLLAKPCSELIVVPLQYRDRILGVYNLFLDRPSAELGKDVRDLLYSIGRHLGLAVEKARLDDNERRLAIMEERNMIGNELHDSLAQSLVSMRLQIKMLGETLHKKDVRAAQDETRRLRAAVEEAHVSLRELLSNFRSRMDERGLIPSIEELIERFKEETGIAVFLQNNWSGINFAPVQEIQVFRIIQESLANIRKHSNACNVRILLDRADNNRYSLLVEDDGHGINDEPGESYRGESIGLSIMRERAEKLLGDLQIESDPGEGTRVLLEFPEDPNPTRLRAQG